MLIEFEWRKKIRVTRVKLDDVFSRHCRWRYKPRFHFENKLSTLLRKEKNENELFLIQIIHYSYIIYI